MKTRVNNTKANAEFKAIIKSKATDAQSNSDMTAPEKGSVENPNCSIKISDVAKQFGLTLRTLRYYEEIGLINPVYHKVGKERLYEKEELEKLTKIKELQDLLGLKLSDIKQVLEVESKFDQLKTEFLSSETIGEKVLILTQAVGTNVELINTVEERLSKLRKYKKELQSRQVRIETKLKSMQNSPKL